VHDLAQSKAEGEGRDNPRQGYGEDRPLVPGNMAEIEFKANQEHQQDQPELTEDGKCLTDIRVEDRVENAREESAEERWAENQTRCDLSANHRLAKAFEKAACNARGCHDHDQLQNGQQHNLFGSRVHRRWVHFPFSNGGGKRDLTRIPQHQGSLRRHSSAHQHHFDPEDIAPHKQEVAVKVPRDEGGSHK